MIPDNPPRLNLPTRFERPPAPPQQLEFRPQSSIVPANQSKQQSSKSDVPPAPLSHTGQEKNKIPIDQEKDGASTSQSVTDDILDSGDGFFVQSGPIPQSQDNTSEKVISVPAKLEKQTADDTKKSLPSESLPTTNKNPKNSGLLPPKAGHIANGPPQQTKLSQHDHFKPDATKDAPRGPQVINQTGPPHGIHGRGRGQGPMPPRGRARGRGRGQFGGPEMDPNSKREIIEEASYDHQAPDDMHREDHDLAWREPSLDGPGGVDDQGEPYEMWHSEELHFTERFHEKVRDRRLPVGHREHPDSTHSEEHWEEPSHDYWEEEDPYWTERRPPIHTRPPFPPGGPRRPPFQPRFMHHGPRRFPPPGCIQHDPQGPPHMNRGGLGPRLRRGAGPWRPPPPRRPPAPHEVLREPDQHEYGDEMDRDPEWHGRGPRQPPLPPHEMIGRGARPPIRPPMPRDRWQRELAHEEAAHEEEYQCNPEDFRYRRPAHEYSDYEQDDEYYSSHDEWSREHPDRDYPPRAPPEPIRENRWLEKSERLYPYEEEDLYREERRPGYPDEPQYSERDPSFHSRPDWDRPLPERGYSHLGCESEAHFERNLDSSAGLPPSQAPDIPLEQSSPGAAKTVLALSQRQHEIILKAAQELKMIR